MENQPPRTSEEYKQYIDQRLNVIERATDKVTSLDQRIDVSNMLLMEILKNTSVEVIVQLPSVLPSYNVRTFLLDTARSSPGEEANLPGDTITAFTNGSLNNTYIRIDSPTSDAIPLKEFNPYHYPAGFQRFYLETTAQEGKYLRLHIGRAAGAEAALGTLNIDVIAQSVGSIAIDIAAQTVGDITISINAATIMTPIDIQGAYIMMPVDIQAQYVTLNIDIVAQTVGNIAIDLAAQSIGNLAVDISAQSIESLNFNIRAQAVTLNIKFLDQATGIMSATDWATREATDIHLQGATASLAAGAEATLITLTLSTAKEHWLYTIHISGTQKGLGKVRANKTGGYDELAYGYFPADSGYIKDWLAPVKRRKDDGAGITEITVTVKNNGDVAGDFSATLDGLTVIDVTAGEKAYTTKAEWDACASKSQVDTATSEGDVLLAIQT